MRHRTGMCSNCDNPEARHDYCPNCGHGDPLHAATESELERLRAENARLIGDHAAALRLVADVRAAIGDDGKRMQPELIEYCKAMKRDAERYRWLRECGDEFDQLIVFDSRGNLVDEFLDAAIDAAMGGGNG